MGDAWPAFAPRLCWGRGQEQTSKLRSPHRSRDDHITAQAGAECHVNEHSWRTRCGLDARFLPLPHLPQGSKAPGLRLWTCRLGLPSLAAPSVGVRVGVRGSELSEKEQTAGHHVLSPSSSGATHEAGGTRPACQGDSATGGNAVPPPLRRPEPGSLSSTSGPATDLDGSLT